MKAKGILIGAGIGVAVGTLYALSRRTAVAGTLPPPTSSTKPGLPMPPSPPPAQPPTTKPVAQPPNAEGQAFFDALSTDPRTRSEQLYRAVMERVTDLPTATVAVKDSNGNYGSVIVTSDAIKLYGVRLNFDTYYLQKVADYFGGILMTQKVADEIWRQAKFKPTPSTRKITSSTAGMLGHSSDVDNKLAALGYSPDSDDLVANVGKDWLLNSWYWLPGKNVQHCVSMAGSVLNSLSGVNYGWFGDAFSPTGTGLKAIQGAANCHDYHHTDYSQVGRIILGAMQVNDQWMSVHDVIVSPQYAGLLSYEGPLQGSRHPSVPYSEEQQGILV